MAAAAPGQPAAGAARPAAATAQPAATWEGKTVRQWADQLTDPDLRIRWYAGYVLGQLGPRAGAAVDALAKVLEKRSEHEYVRGNAAWALGRIGPKAASQIPLLMETMHSRGHVSVRRNSVEALGNLGPAAKAAVPELVKMLDDDDDVTRVNAAVALWNISLHAKALPALLGMLRRGDPTAAYQAAVALGLLEAEPPLVAPGLIDAFRHADADVRRAAARSLGQLGPLAFAALDEKKTLADADPAVRSTAVEALGWMGPTALSPLVKALADKSPAVRRMAARALGRFGPAAKPAEAALVQVVDDPVDTVRDAAAKALRRIRGE